MCVEERRFGGRMRGPRAKAVREAGRPVRLCAVALGLDGRGTLVIGEAIRRCRPDARSAS